MTRKQSEMLKQPILGTDSKIWVRGHGNVQEHSLPSLHGGMLRGTVGVECTDLEQLMTFCLITFDQRSFYDTFQCIVVKLNKYYDHNKTHSYHWNINQ